MSPSNRVNHLLRAPTRMIPSPRNRTTEERRLIGDVATGALFALVPMLCLSESDHYPAHHDRRPPGRPFRTQRFAARCPQGLGILGKGDAEEGEDFLGVTAIIAEGFRNRAPSCPMQHADDGIAQDRHGARPVAFVEID